MRQRAGSGRGDRGGDGRIRGYRMSVRWWIAGRTVHALLLMTLGALAGLSVVVAAAWTLTERLAALDGGPGSQTRSGCFDLSLGVLRACVGTDNLDPNRTAPPTNCSPPSPPSPARWYPRCCSASS